MLACGLAGIVLPMAVSRIVAAQREGTRTAPSVRVSAWIAASMLAAALPVWVVLAVRIPRSGDGQGATLAWVLAVVTLLILAGSGHDLLQARSRARSSAASDPAATIDPGIFDDSEASRRLEETIRRLIACAPLYKMHHVNDVPAGPTTSDRIHRIVALTQELFRRLRARGTEQQVRLATVRYADILCKVARLVSPEYLRDVLDHPELWHHPEQRVQEVWVAIDEVERQLLINARQANEANDIDFQVALSSLAAIGEDEEFAALYGSEAQ